MSPPCKLYWRARPGISIKCCKAVGLQCRVLSSRFQNASLQYRNASWKSVDGLFWWNFPGLWPWPEPAQLASGRWVCPGACGSPGLMEEGVAACDWSRHQHGRDDCKVRCTQMLIHSRILQARCGAIFLTARLSLALNWWSTLEGIYKKAVWKGSALQIFISYPIKAWATVSMLVCLPSCHCPQSAFFHKCFWKLRLWHMLTLLSWCCSLAYFDTYRRARLPANLTQAQRDYFGAHTYERIDAEGVFHTEWSKLASKIWDIWRVVLSKCFEYGLLDRVP